MGIKLKIIKPKTDQMKLIEIQDLIKFVAKSGVSEVEIETDGVKLVIKTGGGKRGAKGQLQQQAPVVMQAPAPQVQSAPAVAAAPAPAAPAEVAKPVEQDNYVTIKSPMIGTFYRKSAPEKPSFVNVGDEVNEGSVLCIIEAMKLFNEIESEISGKIVKVLVDDNTPVEYDQPLFLVEPRK
jgi:acetyl-CoA carboxylase biotin carboxyl carrier protein